MHFTCVASLLTFALFCAELSQEEAEDDGFVKDSKEPDQSQLMALVKNGNSILTIVDRTPPDADGEGHYCCAGCSFFLRSFLRSFLPRDGFVAMYSQLCPYLYLKVKS